MRTAAPTLYLPRREVEPSIAEVTRFVANLDVECSAALRPDHVERLMDVKSGHGVRTTSPAYWHTAYDRLLHAATQRVVGAGASPRVLDVCAGTGTQSLLFAALGGRVVALDHSPDQLAVLEARLDLYRSASDAPLDLSVIRGDATTLDAVTGPFDVIYSHAGWSALLDAPALVARARSLLAPGGSLVLWQVNPRSTWRRLMASAPAPSIDGLVVAGRHQGLDLVDLQGSTSLPRAVWSRAPRATEPLDRVLRRLPRTWVHFQITLRRRP